VCQSHLVDVAETPVLKVCQVLKQRIIYGRDRLSLLLCITLLVPPDQKQPKSASNADLCSDTSNDKPATRLVDRCLGAEEAVGTDDVADTVGEEDKGRCGCTLGVAADVGCRELESDDETTDEGGAL
jgi:hypothetical protein